MTDLDAHIADLETRLREAKQERKNTRRKPLDIPGGAIYFAVGTAIRQARIACRISQGDLARAAKLSRVSISNIECGRNGMPFATLYDIAKTLGVQAAALLPRNEDV